MTDFIAGSETVSVDPVQPAQITEDPEHWLFLGISSSF
jgi:hypothetical protein